VGVKRMWVPMTLSNLESWDARGQIFPADLSMLVPFDLERPNLAW